MANQIWMRFGMVGWMGPEMRQIVGFEDRSMRWGNFGGECGMPHCNQWGVRRGLFPNYFGQSCCLVLLLPFDVNSKLTGIWRLTEHKSSAANKTVIAVRRISFHMPHSISTTDY